MRPAAAGEVLKYSRCWSGCRNGYLPDGAVCWQYCPAGYLDDGLTCRRDAHIIGANNDDCPWYDKCGLTLARVCSTCPKGYTNDGCTCRKDAHIFGKDSYYNGVGSPPSCAPDEQYDARGLCYTPCRPGYTGVGPVCWED